MQPGTKLVHLAAAIALALKWQTTDVVLQAEGCTLMIQGDLGQTSPPYMLEVHKRQVIPAPPKRRNRQTREKVEMDLGKIHGDAHPPLAYPHVCNDGGVLGAGTGASSSSGEPLSGHDISQEAWENAAMAGEDVNVRAVRIKRPRDSLRVQYVGSLKVEQLLSAFAASKRVRQDGFVLYQQVSNQDDVNPESSYFLTWQKQNRGGSSITTTEPVSSDSLDEMSESDSCAREELSRLEDLVNRISMANSYLTLFRKRVTHQPPQVITLQQWKERRDIGRQELRGGMMAKSKQNVSRWESTSLEQGLQLRTKLRVKLKEKDEGTLQKLVTSDVVSGATGYALLSWETWSAMAGLRSPKPLVIILPGVKTAQIEALGSIDMSRVRTPEVVMEHNESQESKKPGLFSKRVTVINVTESTEYCFELEHGGSRIEIHPAFEHQILVDLYEDTAAKTQDWSVYGLRQVFQNILQTWTIDGSYEPQWPTVRYVALAQRATVVLRADARARVSLLRASGQNLLFTRESVSRDKASVQSEYTVVWLQTVAHQGSPAGVIKALATQIEGHYGVCRNAKGYGIRAGNGTLAVARTLLRPSDASLNDRNRPMIPTKTYTLRGVSAKATGAELAHRSGTSPSYNLSVAYIAT